MKKTYHQAVREFQMNLLVEELIEAEGNVCQAALALEIHRNTWRYNKLIEEQRRIVLDYRDRVLRTDAARKALSERCPERLKELGETVDNDVITEAARQITLYHLDRAWADHIADLADVPVEMEVQLGHKILTIAQILELGPESVIRMARSAGDNIDILAGGTLLGYGEIVIIEDAVGVRITDFNQEE